LSKSISLKKALFYSSVGQLIKIFLYEKSPCFIEISDNLSKSIYAEKYLILLGFRATYQNLLDIPWDVFKIRIYTTSSVTYGQSRATYQNLFCRG
jgi:hypothetical protein